MMWPTPSPARSCWPGTTTASSSWGGSLALAEPPLTANPRVTARGPFRSADLPAWLDRADVGLSTSLFETFHRVTREYLLAGLPVIGSRAFGIPDIVRPGVNGLLYDHADPDSLTRAVVALLDDPPLLSALTEGARRTLVRSVEEEADELAALYLDVLATATDRPLGPGAESDAVAGHPVRAAGR